MIVPLFLVSVSQTDFKLMKSFQYRYIFLCRRKRTSFYPYMHTHICTDNLPNKTHTHTLSLSPLTLFSSVCRVSMFTFTPIQMDHSVNKDPFVGLILRDQVFVLSSLAYTQFMQQFDIYFSFGIDCGKTLALF